MFPKQKNTAHQKNLFPLPLTGFSRLTIGLFFLGFLAGYIGAHFLENYIHSTVISLFRDTINQLPWLSIDRNEIFLLSFKNHLTSFLLLVFFSLTNVWRLYYIGSTIYTGFSQGLLFCFCTISYGLGGIPQYFCFLLPQAILLVPVFLLILNRLERFHYNWFLCEPGSSKRTLSFFSTQKRQLLFHQLPFLFICIILLFCCSILEGYLNVPIIKAYSAGLK